MTSDRTAPILQLRNVSLSYGGASGSRVNTDELVLDDISLDVFEGETLGVIGRNGVGKTSMLRVMAGILAPDTGNVIVKPGVSSSLLTLGLGFKGNLTGRDNALLSAMLSGASKRKAMSFLEDIKEFSELGDAFEEPEKTYSEGMRLRLGFTTALKTDVDILLIDEVLSVGDERFREKAESAMRERMTSDQTVVFVSHFADQVRNLCDRVIWLEGGKTIHEGETNSVLEAYQSNLHGAAN